FRNYTFSSYQPISLFQSISLQGLRRSFFNLAATATSASIIRPRSVKMTGNDMRLARADGFTVVPDTRAPGAADSGDRDMATADCVGAGVGRGLFSDF